MNKRTRGIILIVGSKLLTKSLILEINIVLTFFTMKNIIIPKNKKDLIKSLSNYSVNSKIIAGGTDLMIGIRSGFLDPDYLISLENLKLDYISEKKSKVVIGSTCLVSSLAKSELIIEKFPLLVDACLSLGSPPIQNLATIGGNVANASPAADLILPLITYEAKAKISGPFDSRLENVENIFTGPKVTILKQDEFIEEFELPILKEEEGITNFYQFYKSAARVSQIIAVANACFLISIKKGKICKARLSAGCVYKTPLRLFELEKYLKGSEISKELISGAEALLLKSVFPINDVRGSAVYKTKLVNNYFRHFMEGILCQI
ncbi:MAG: FAD binding domain-containing protein [Pseudomonadota bacterium]